MIQLNASARLKAYRQAERNVVKAASANDAGKIVLWAEKALPWKYNKGGKAGQDEKVTFRKKFGDSVLWLTISLDHTQEGSPIFIEGGVDNLNKKFKAQWMSNEKTGRQTIISLKKQMRRYLEKVGSLDGAEEVSKAIHHLINAKSKVE